jgi:hypothetical protein
MQDSASFSVEFDLINGNLTPYHANVAHILPLEDLTVINFAYVDPLSSPTIEQEQQGNKTLLARPFVRIAFSHAAAKQLSNQLQAHLQQLHNLGILN